MTMKLKQNTLKAEVINVTPPEECLHLEISSESEGKCACLECGLVQPIGVSNYSYVRSITHYKLLLAEGRPVPPIHYLVGEVLQKQVIRLKERQIKTVKKNESQCINEPLKVLYQEYICFLRDNQDIVLPKKRRKRELVKIYGEHHKIVLEWITALMSLPLS